MLLRDYLELSKSSTWSDMNNNIVKYTFYFIGILSACSFRLFGEQLNSFQKQQSGYKPGVFTKISPDTIPRDTIPRDTVRFMPPDSLLYEVQEARPAPPPPQPAPPPPAAPTQIPVEFTTVKVWFATDRDKTTDKVPFGGGRSELSYGQCEVTVPKIHKVGEIESRSLFEWFFEDDPAKHMILKKTSPIAESAYFSKLSASINTSSDKGAFIFIHGYNTSFEDAAKRTAQISYDLKFSGAPVFFSWPSQGEVSKYTYDEANIEWAQTHVEKFLTDFLKKTTSRNLYIIAHSMGNRAMTRAIASVTSKFPAYKSRIKAIILAAPDIDSDVFKRDIAPALISSCKNITLYTSNSDKALMASKEVHGHSRLGDNLNGVVTIPGIESVDASDIESDFLAHSYFSSTKTVISDMFSIIKEGKPASRRFGLEKINASPMPYWRFSK